MNLNVFEYDEITGRAVLNSPDLLLIQEFKSLLEPARNKCKEDSTGKKHLLADKEFAYIYLALDWKSPYSNYSELERHEAALQDSGLTEDQFNDPTFRAACRKYRNLLESNRYVRLLKSAELVTDKIIDYFNNVDVEERDEQTRKYVNKVSDIQKAMDNAAKQVETLKLVESLVKKELTEQSSIRGGAVEGFNPNDIDDDEGEWYYEEN